MFVSSAFAQTAGTAGGAQDAIMQFLPLILIFAVMYFLLIRPQQRRAKEHRRMLTELRRGDQVVTSGGIIAKVTKVRDTDEVELEISENTRVRVVKSTIANVLSKTDAVTTPVAANTK